MLDVDVLSISIQVCIDSLSNAEPDLSVIHIPEYDWSNSVYETQGGGTS